MVFTDRQLKITPIRSYLSRGIGLEEATGNIAILASGVATNEAASEAAASEEMWLLN